MEMKLWHAVGRRFGKSDINGSIEFLEKRLAKQKVGRFERLLGNGQIG